jgi:FlaA1/EpsC-like NDP-sugar epimerase
MQAREATGRAPAAMDGEECTMYRERARIIDGCLFTLDLLALTASFPVAYFVRDYILGERYINHPGLYSIGHYWPLLVLSLVAWVVTSRASRVYQARRLPSITSEVYRAGRTLLVVAAAVAGAGFFTKRADFSRLFLCCYFTVGMGLLFLDRLLLRNVLRALRRHGYSTRILAVVGTGDLARQVAEAITARREWGYHFAGYIEEDDAPGPRRVGPLLGSVSKLEEMLGKKILDEIVFAVSRERLQDLESAALLCRKEGVIARICLDLPLAKGADLSLESLNGIPMLGLY